MRTVDWDETSSALLLIDQRVLPHEFRILHYNDYRNVAEAIRSMVVRGAPAIGATAAYGLALAAQQSGARSLEELRRDLNDAAELLKATRPTAVNLAWALDRMLFAASNFEGSVEELRAKVLEEARKIADEDAILNRRMAQYGAALIEDGDVIIHHCNTGSLATVEWGTALGVIRMAHEQGKKIHVLVDETRPRLQGARLTAWELQQYHIPFDIITDNAAGYFLSTGQAHKVLFGADRIAANGDVANKIGTYMLALAAVDNQAPVYAVAPTSTIDLRLEHGSLIPIEERDPDEVLNLQIDGKDVAPAGSCARNPAFDVTPFRLITAIVTENGIVFPPYSINLRRAVEENLG